MKRMLVSRNNKWFWLIVGLALLCTASIMPTTARATDMTNAAFARDFVATAIAPKDWVRRVDSINFHVKIWKDLVERDTFNDQELIKDYEFYLSLQKAYTTYSKDEVIRRWVSPIIIEPSSDPIVQDQLIRFSRHIKDQLGLSIHVADTYTDPTTNVQINIYDLCMYKGEINSSRRAVCLGHHNDDAENPSLKRNYKRVSSPFMDQPDCTAMTADEKDRIEGYTCSDENHHIYISECNILIALPEPIKRKYVSECLLRSLGFPNVSSTTEPTILNGDTGSLPDTEMTPYDLMMARALYSPALKPGMSKQEALTAVHTYLQMPSNPEASTDQ